MKLTHRTIRHDDGSKIQLRTPADMHPASWVSSRVIYRGAPLGHVYHLGGRVDVHPLIGAYITGVVSIAEAARMLVRMNGGMPARGTSK